MFSLLRYPYRTYPAFTDADPPSYNPVPTSEDGNTDRANFSVPNIEMDLNNMDTKNHENDSSELENEM